MKKPTIFQIKEAIIKNTCRPDADELEDLATSKVIRTSTKREGSADLGMVLLVGLSSAYGYSYSEIMLLTSVDLHEYLDEYIAKFKVRVKSNNKRFLHKLKLIQNYLKIVYGIQIFPVAGK